MQRYIGDWKKFKRSGTIYRRAKKITVDLDKEEVQKRFKKVLPVTLESSGTQVKIINNTNTLATDLNIDVNDNSSNSGYVHCTYEHVETEIELNDDDSNCTDNEDDSVELQDLYSAEDFREDMKDWAIASNISHIALKELLRIMRKKEKLRCILPADPRTLLKTDPLTVVVTDVGDGQYWHQGVEFCLRNSLISLSEPVCIKLNINIDGLPLYSSSNKQFWPILGSIYGMKEYGVLVFGIYLGVSKPSNLVRYLQPFVNEVNTRISQGLVINGHEVHVGIRCFICDTPARCFVKGKKDKK